MTSQKVFKLPTKDGLVEIKYNSEEELYKKIEEREAKTEPLFLTSHWKNLPMKERIVKILIGCSFSNSEEAKELELWLVEKKFQKHSGMYDLPEFLNLCKLEREHPKIFGMVKEYQEKVFQKAEINIISLQEKLGLV